MEQINIFIGSIAWFKYKAIKFNFFILYKKIEFYIIYVIRNQI